MIIYGTFASGLQKPIEKWLKEDGHKVRVVLDGAIIYEVKSGKSSALPCFFNTFSVINQTRGSIEDLMRKTLRRPNVKKGRGSFRLVTSKENQLTSVDNRLRNEMEKAIASQSGLIPDRRGGKGVREFWFLSRSEGIVLFMERIQMSGKSERIVKLKKGELCPQLAYCLNRLGSPQPSDIMLDPFCGHEAIPRSRAKHFPCKEILFYDKMHQNRGHRADIVQLPTMFPENSIDVIVTDPPWGVYKEEDVSALYESFAKVCGYLLKPDGRLVVLSAQKELMHMLFPVNTCYNILVSGQKAAIFVINLMRSEK